MTTPVSIFALVAVLTLALFLGLLNLSFWRVQRVDPTPLWLAAWLTASAILALCRLLQYIPLSDTMYIVLPRILLSAGYSLAWIGYELANTFIGYRPPRWERTLIVLLVAVPVMLLWTSRFILTDEVILRTIQFGGAFHGVEVGFLYLPASLLILALGMIPILRLLRARDSHKRENLLMAVGFFIVILFSLYDFIVTSLNLGWIRLSDYNYMPVAVFFSHIQVQRFGQIYRDLNVLVQERTAEMTRANETLRAEISERQQTQEALQDSEERYRLLFEANPHPMWVYDLETLAFLFVNDAAITRYGYTREEFLHMTILDIRPPEEVSKLIDNLQRDRQPMEWSGPWMHVKKDGTIIHVEILSHSLVFGEKPARLVLANDITERLRVEEEIHRKVNELTALHGTTHDLVIERNLPKLLYTIVERAVSLLNASGGDLYLCEPELRQVRCVVSYNTLHDYTGVVLKYGEGAAGLVAEKGEPLIITDYRTWEGRAAIFEQDQPFISMLSVPMRWQDNVIGIIHVLESTRHRTFTQEDLQVLTLFANQAAIAVENTRLFEIEQRRSQEAAALAEVGRDISASLKLDFVLERIATHAEELLRSDTSAVYMSEPAKQMLRAVAAIGPEADEIKHDPLKIGEGILGNIAARKMGEIVNDSAADSRAITIRGTENIPHEHLMGAPILSKDWLTGLIAVWRTGAGKEYTSADLDFLTRLAEQAAIAIQNARMFEGTRRRLAELEILQTIASALRIAQTPDEAFPIILDQLIKLLDVGSAMIELLDPSGEEIVSVLAHGVWAPITGKRIPANAGVSGQVISSGQPYITTDVIVDESDVRPGMVAGLFSMACVPIIALHRPIGTLWIGRQSQASISQEEVKLLTALGEMVGNTIQRMKLHQQTVRQAKEITLAYELTLEGWAKALELRDKETEGHSRRVSELTLQLARDFGVSAADLVHIHRGVLLHDIGKMGVPDQILKKTGPLNDEEWGEMRKHPQYAFDLIFPIAYLRPALDIPYCHHEKWDGSGYPRGLKEDQIPLAARIFAIVDVYDALSNDRPYRLAWPRPKVLDYLSEQSGKHFDPKVVDAFLQLDAIQ